MNEVEKENRLYKVEVFLTNARNNFTKYFSNFSAASADTFAWLSIIVILCSTIPSLLAVKAGLSDRMPPLDLVLLTWIGLLLFFLRSAIIKDMLMVVTIGFGFAIQAILLGLIFFV